VPPLGASCTPISNPSKCWVCHSTRRRERESGWRGFIHLRSAVRWRVGRPATARIRRAPSGRDRCRPCRRPRLERWLAPRPGEASWRAGRRGPCRGAGLVFLCSRQILADLLGKDVRVAPVGHRRLRLLAARVALLSHDDTAFKADVTAASAWLKQYFDTRQKNVQSLVTNLMQLAATPMPAEVPDVSASLNALRTVKAIRERAPASQPASPR